jgi:hypothetical protein
MDFPAAEALFESRKPPEAALDKIKIRELVEVLECLPLAISQAAVYIAHYEVSVDDYLELISADDREMGELLDVEITDTRRDWESQHSVFRTWKVSTRSPHPRAFPRRYYALWPSSIDKGSPRMC